MFDSPSRLPKFDLLKKLFTSKQKAQFKTCWNWALFPNRPSEMNAMPVLARVRSPETALLQLSLLEHQL